MSKLTEQYDDEESPASRPTFISPMFKDGGNIYKHSETKFLTFSLEPMLQPSFEVRIKMNSIHVGYVVIGVSNKYFDYEERQYLGGDLGTGNWGIASNGSLGVEGSWQIGLPFDNGDILTLTGCDGVIGYTINDKSNDYSYDMKTSDLYLSFTFHYEGDEIEIL